MAHRPFPPAEPLSQPCHTVLLLGLSLAALVGPACSSDAPQPAAALSTLLGGDATAGDESVVLLRGPDGVVCSGTLISPRVVLTAATCLAPDGKSLRVHFGRTPDPAAPGLPVIHAQPHPRFRGGTFEHNLALLVLGEAAPVEPSAAPYGRSGLAEVGYGQLARLVGFGGPQATSGSSLTKRTGNVGLHTVTPAAFFYDPRFGAVCVGDEGGPLFLTIDGVEYLAGVIGRLPDQVCVERSSFAQRVDPDVEDFILPFLRITSPGGALAGERCLFAGTCGEGDCVPALGVPTVAYCANGCDVGAGCPAGTTCLPGPEGTRCRYPVAMPEVLGLFCAKDSDCETGRCGRALRGGAKACTAACDPEVAPACPEGFACRALVGEPGTHACFGLNLEAPSGENGCSSSPTGSRAWPLILLLIGGLAYRRRKRRAPTQGQGDPAGL